MYPWLTTGWVHQQAETVPTTPQKGLYQLSWVRGMCSCALCVGTASFPPSLPPSSHLSSGSSALTDSDRDQIDSDAQEFIKVCSERITVLQQEGITSCLHRRARAHTHTHYALHVPTLQL